MKRISAFRAMTVLAALGAMILIGCGGGGGGGAKGGLTNGYDVNLSSLEISSGTLSPAFDQTVTGYSVTVDDTVASIKVTLSAVDSNATISVNGEAVSSGSSSGSIALTEGTTTGISIVITAPDATTTKTYSVGVLRKSSLVKSANANLGSLVISNGTLTPKFNPDIISYRAEIASTESSSKITPTVSYEKSTVTVNNAAVESGEASSPISLSVGINRTSVKVTAEDGMTKTYNIELVRVPDKSKNAFLGQLYLSSGALSPVFNKTKTSYVAEVASNVSSITVTPSIAGVNAVAKVNGAIVETNKASAQINLSVGTNTITVEVWAEDVSSYMKYTVTVNRLASGTASSNANIAGLSSNIGTISPAFDPSVSAYTFFSNSDTYTLTPVTAGTNATVKVNGKEIPSGTTSMTIPATTATATIAVTAADGTTKTYTITVVHDTSAPTAGTLNAVVIEPRFVTLAWTA